MLKGTTAALSLTPALQKPLTNGILQDSFSRGADLPGGSPFSLCQASQPTDLFDIQSVELTKQPVYMYVT